MSWGTPENNRPAAERLALNARFVKLNVSFFASAGDTGNFSCLGRASLCWPATSRFVTAAGGTTLHIDAKANYITENAWKGAGTDSQPGIPTAGGGGFSLYENVPDYQTPFNPYTKRGLPDVSYNANPNLGFAVFDSNPFQGSTGWQEIGGTSASAPQWAALVALANSIRNSIGKASLSGSNPQLYTAATGASYASNYHDITAGTNTNGGGCGPLCSATVGYDFVTGLGSPNAANLINALASLP